MTDNVFNAVVHHFVRHGNRFCFWSQASSYFTIQQFFAF